MNSASGDTETDAAGFVLAGGESSRMGRDKALQPFAGRPLVECALSILREAGLEPGIAGARAALDGFAPVVADAEPGLGPLSGVCAALVSASARRAVFLPVDLPLLPPSLIVFLLRRAQITGRAVTVASVSGFAQTFPAVLDRAALPALRNELENGRRGCFAAFQAAAASLKQSLDLVPAEFLVQSGKIAHVNGLPTACWFQSVNTPDQLRRAEARAGIRLAPAPRARFA
ncbi:MAG: molybdenum cofactor guanylyltransferase [Terracidiphilus sp.]